MLQFGVCNFSSKGETFDKPALMRAARGFHVKPPAEHYLQLEN